MFWMIILIVACVVAASASVFLFAQGFKYFLELQAVRLDPYGLGYYPIDGSDRPKGDGKLLAVFLGDSRANAWTPPADVDGMSFVNRGIDGQTTQQVLGRFEEHVATLKPDVVILQVGVNDLKGIAVLRGERDSIVANAKRNLSKLVARSRELGAEVILTTVFPTGRCPLRRQPFWSDAVPQAIEEVNTHLSSLAGPEVLLLDTASILAGENGKARKDYALDLMHINVRGYEALNSELTPRLQYLVANSSK